MIAQHATIAVRFNITMIIIIITITITITIMIMIMIMIVIMIMITMMTTTTTTTITAITNHNDNENKNDSHGSNSNVSCCNIPAVKGIRPQLMMARCSDAMVQAGAMLLPCLSSAVIGVRQGNENASTAANACWSSAYM